MSVTYIDVIWAGSLVICTGDQLFSKYNSEGIPFYNFDVFELI